MLIYALRDPETCEIRYVGKADDGEKNVKLTEGDVRRIRALCADGTPGTEVARQFGITAANVSLIHRRKAWAHVPD